MGFGVLLDNSTTKNPIKCARLLLDMKFETSALNHLKMALTTTRSTETHTSQEKITYKKFGWKEPGAFWKLYFRKYCKIRKWPQNINIDHYQVKCLYKTYIRSYKFYMYPRVPNFTQFCYTISHLQDSYSLSFSHFPQSFSSFWFFIFVNFKGVLDSYLAKNNFIVDPHRSDTPFVRHTFWSSPPIRQPMAR